ncbi:MAG: hypothetical protein QXK47_02420 [Candidatus Bathyarchaeia archaeon]
MVVQEEDWMLEEARVYMRQARKCTIKQLIELSKLICRDYCKFAFDCKFERADQCPIQRKINIIKEVIE